ncbi:MAG TPA: bi-domain-containing oxidoreductase [Acidimicrobiales bacterium]|nr:bi-domain-containing oxidoreductase [Acidimicrobiales bacterium]
MKQVAQNYKTGELAVLDVPPPACSPGGVLVRSLYSLISTGTELMKVGESKMSLIGKARARPDQMKKVLDTVAQQGPMNAYRKVMNKLDSYTPLGYSLAGVVVEVGRGAEELHVGQLVACAGNEFALHAELNWVPVNLCVPVPDGVPAHLAAFATVGSIALQGVRQGAPALGDTAVVVGLGLVGQLVVQLLVASGVKVVGIDMVPERCQLAEKSGALLCAAPEGDGLAAVESAVARASDGLGADHIFLVASGSSNGPVELAAKLARDRARVVDIGKCKLDLPWSAYYEKELELRFSRSYGPGRYDPSYEVEGIDYPAGYVRWTERRNLACFVDLVASGDIDPEPLVSGTYPLEDATDVYARMASGDLKGVGFLFKYKASEPGRTGDEPPAEPAQDLEVLSDGTSQRAKPLRSVRRSAYPATETVKVGFIGAGNYASSMLLPHIAGREGTELVRVATRKSLSAVNAQKKFGFSDACTSTAAVLDDAGIDVVFVVTPHSSHASLVCQALEAGKTVFVEKPLCLSTEELDKILATVEATGNDRLMVGFNRRFSPMLTTMRKHFGRASEPMITRYFVNAGPLSHGTWYANEETEGSRFIGEGGHFIDTLSWWTGSDPVEVSALATSSRDNIQTSIRFSDGSLGTVTYFINGHPRFPKETFEAACGGRSARLDNFKKASVYAGRVPRAQRSLGSQDKGQKDQMDAFFEAVRSGGPMPISLASLVATTKATLAAERSLASGQPQSL